MSDNLPKPTISKLTQAMHSAEILRHQQARLLSHAQDMMVIANKEADEAIAKLEEAINAAGESVPEKPEKTESLPPLSVGDQVILVGETSVNYAGTFKKGDVGLVAKLVPEWNAVILEGDEGFVGSNNIKESALRLVPQATLIRS